MTFDDLGLLPELLRAVREQGYETPTPIQAQAIPLLLQGRDLMAGAQTGTGKTAAFTLPLLQMLAPLANTSTSPARHPIRALILTPTRELAMQVEESVRTYGKHLRLRSTTIFGGVNINPQVKELRAGVEILVATPGRLLDHHQQGNLHFGHLEFLVLDEADRMLDMGFIRDIRKILALLPAKRQSILCSATFGGEIRGLAASFLHDPASVDVAPHNTPTELVEHVVHPVDRERKRALLSHLIRSRKLEQVLVFCRTKHGANRLSELLERDGIRSMAIHGNKSQPQRIKALEDFKAGRITALVATDIAARGLDIDQLPHVVNYELPHVPEDYVHRIGRTGRAGMEGEALSLVCVDEHKLLKDIERLLQRPLPKVPVSGFEPDPGIAPEPLETDPAVRRAAARARSGRAPAGNQPRNVPQRISNPAAEPAGKPAPRGRHAAPKGKVDTHAQGRGSRHGSHREDGVTRIN